MLHLTVLFVSNANAPFVHFKTLQIIFIFGPWNKAQLSKHSTCYAMEEIHILRPPQILSD